MNVSAQTTTYRVKVFLQPYARKVSDVAYLNYNDACVAEANHTEKNHWNEGYAAARAREEGIVLLTDHWETIRILQEELLRPNEKELHRIMNDKFHEKGGFRYLSRIFTDNPVTQGCRLAGVTPPWN